MRWNKEHQRRTEGHWSEPASAYLSFRVVGSADQRARFHVAEAEGEAFDFEIGT